MHAGFVGTGNMGSPMAANVLKAGHRLTVYDVRPEATTELERLGAERAADLRRSGPEGLAVSQQRVAGDDGAPLPQALGEVETALLAPDLAVAEQRARQDVRRRRRARSGS